MADIKNYEPALANNAVVAGGAIVISLGGGTSPQICCGSSTPSLTAAKGSLYLRTDGSTTNDRIYVNTDGGTTWTAITTAA